MRYTSIVRIFFLISLVIIPTSNARVSSIPYSEESFTKDFRFDPLNATLRAAHNNHLPYIYRLNFSNIPSFISDKVLDIALNDDFPGTKIAEAIQTGTILKLSTWKRLTQTQLATTLPSGETLRDASPDLRILNPAGRDGSIHDNAKLGRDDMIITQPSAGATSHTESQKVTMTSLENIILSYSLLSIKGNNIEQFSISSTELSFDLGNFFEIQLPRNSLREPIFPGTGVSTTERRLITVHNATNVRFTTEGRLLIEGAGLIQLYSPQIALSRIARAPTTSTTLSPLNPPLPQIPITLSRATGIIIHLLDLTNASPEEIIHPVLIEFESAKEANVLGMQADGVNGGVIDLASDKFSFLNLKHLTQEPIELSGLPNASITVRNGIHLTMENDSDTLLYLGPTELHYHTDSSTNLLHIDPAKPHTLTITGSTLSFIQDDAIQDIKAGNQTRVTLDEQGTFSCAYFTPFSSYTRKPLLIDHSLSVVTFKTPHSVCTTTHASPQPSCTRDCTLINIAKKTLIQNGPADLQHPFSGFGHGLPQSVMTSYGSGTAQLSFDESLFTISKLDILDKKPILALPTPAISITEQEGHRLLTLDKTIPTNQQQPLWIKSIQSPNLPLFQIEPMFAFQSGTRGNGVYILFPNNPHVQELITLSDKRLEHSP